MEGQRALRFHQKYLHLCSEDERRSYGFGTTCGWVINDRIFIFGWTIPLNSSDWPKAWKKVTDVFCLYRVIHPWLTWVLHLRGLWPCAERTWRRARWWESYSPLRTGPTETTGGKAQENVRESKQTIRGRQVCSHTSEQVNERQGPISSLYTLLMNAEERSRPGVSFHERNSANNTESN